MKLIQVDFWKKEVEMSFLYDVNMSMDCTESKDYIHVIFLFPFIKWSKISIRKFLLNFGMKHLVYCNHSIFYISEWIFIEYKH